MIDKHEKEQVIHQFIEAFRKRLQRKTGWGRKELLAELAYARFECLGNVVPNRAQQSLDICGPPIEWHDLEDE
jgi:hypothetical protein